MKGERTTIEVNGLLPGPSDLLRVVIARCWWAPSQVGPDHKEES